MTDTLASLRRKIGVATDLQSVVRTMKALAASNIVQYENSVRALTDYARTVDLGLSVCLRRAGPNFIAEQKKPPAVSVFGVVVFGSDQGLVGRFNEVVVDHMLEKLAVPHNQIMVWAVGERVYGRLTDVGLQPAGLLNVPNSVKGIAPLIGEVLVGCEKAYEAQQIHELYIFYNQPSSGALYSTVSHRLLPLDEKWRRTAAALPWPTQRLPETTGSGTATLRAYIGEYLFVSLFRACAESLASENASRLAAMRRADKNIEEMLEDQTWTYHRLRQSGIDEELFDVIAGFEAQSVKQK